MKHLSKILVILIIIGLLTPLAHSFISIWTPMLINSLSQEQSQIISTVLTILIGIFLCYNVLTSNPAPITYVINKAIVFALIGFALGFFIVPILFWIFTGGGDFGLLPIWGIFVTGPGGFIIGLITGIIQWKSKNKAPTS